MISKATARFWKCYEALPVVVKKKAREAYVLFQEDPWYPGLHFKRIHSTLPVYSVRITKDYRAVGILQDEKIVWFWVGSHSSYNNLLKQMKSA